MSSITIINWLFHDMQFYLFIAWFDLTNGLFQQTFVRVYYIFNLQYWSCWCWWSWILWIEIFLIIRKWRWDFLVDILFFYYYIVSKKNASHRDQLSLMSSSYSVVALNFAFTFTTEVFNSNVLIVDLFIIFIDQ